MRRLIGRITQIVDALGDEAPDATLDGYALISDEEKAKLEEMGGGFIERMIDGKAPSIKEMKAIIRKAGFGVADLVEKSEVEARYREAVVRLGNIAKQDESYTGYFEREEDLK